MAVPGNYVFGVHFNDGTNITTKQVTVQVFASNQPPVISSLQSRIPVLVTLPVDTTVLQGSAFDLEADPLTMQFSVVNQPGGASAQVATLQTTASSIRSAARNLTIPGDYVFRFTVSDASSTVSRDITVTVYPLDNAPLISSVSASPAVVTAPASSADLSAITSDPDLDTVTHWWLVESAPGGANPIFSAQGERNTTVSNLTVPGTYVFTLRAIDRTLFTARNDTIVVNSILPVSILEFFAKLIAPQTALVTWETASESNSSYFNIQRSFGGRSFTNIGTIRAAGNSNTLLKYAYTDNGLPVQADQPASVYYRLDQVNTDGKELYSSLAIVPLSKQNVSMLINPNPVSNVLNIQVFNASGPAAVSVYDMTGKMILVNSRAVERGAAFQFNTSTLVKGCYYLQLKIMGKTLQQKVIKD